VFWGGLGEGERFYGGFGDDDGRAANLAGTLQPDRVGDSAGRLASLYEQFKPRVILAEENSVGSVNIEALRAEGLPVQGFVTTHKSKAPLIEGLSLAMEKEEVVLLDDDTLKHELMSYEMTRNAYGWSYSAPPGGHDDTVVATALSLWASRRYGGALISFG
jgi:hypothetical protein